MKDRRQVVLKDVIYCICDKNKGTCKSEETFHEFLKESLTKGNLQQSIKNDNSIHNSVKFVRLLLIPEVIIFIPFTTHGCKYLQIKAERMQFEHT